MWWSCSVLVILHTGVTSSFLSWCLSFSVIGGQEQLKFLLALSLDRANVETNREGSQFWDVRIEPELGSSFMFGSSLMKDLSSKIEADVQVGKNWILCIKMMLQRQTPAANPPRNLFLVISPPCGQLSLVGTCDRRQREQLLVTWEERKPIIFSGLLVSCLFFQGPLQRDWLKPASYT